MAGAKVRKMRNIPFFPGSSPKSLALLENPENPQGFLGTGCDTDMVLYSTRILKDSALRHQRAADPRAGHMATEPLIMPSDGGLRFESQFAPAPNPRPAFNHESATMVTLSPAVVVLWSLWCHCGHSGAASDGSVVTLRSL